LRDYFGFQLLSRPDSSCTTSVVGVMIILRCPKACHPKGGIQPDLARVDQVYLRSKPRETNTAVVLRELGLICLRKHGIRCDYSRPVASAGEPGILRSARKYKRELNYRASPEFAGKEVL